MSSTPGYVSNATLAARISALVDRWNTRENQMIALLTQEEGEVTVTDGLGQNHSLPSMRQLVSDVASIVSEVSGVGVSAAEAANQASLARNAAQAYADDASLSAGRAEVARGDAEDMAAAAAVSEAAAAAGVSLAAASAASAAESASAAATSSTTAANAAGAAASSATTASTQAVAAEGHALKAALWADAPQGTQVEPGAFSARHWAAQAQAAVTGTLVYMGAWSPTSGAYPAEPAKGHFYRVSAAGTFDGYAFNAGDQILFNGDAWDVIDNTDEVWSVAGKTGAVTLLAGDIGGLGALATRNDVNWASHVAGKPETFPPDAHTHTWTTIAGRPSVFPPESHTHATADVTGLTAALASKADDAAVVKLAGTQTITGAKTFSGALHSEHSAGVGLVLTRTNALSNSTIQYVTNGGTIYAGMQSATAWRIGPNANLASAPWFSAEPTAAYVADQEVWHAGNFNPGAKADVGGQVFTGSIATTAFCSAARFLSNSGEVHIGSGTTGTIALRPNGGASQLGQFTVATNGNIAAAGNLAVHGSSATVGGNTVWHAGNFNPDGKANSSHGHSANDISSGTLSLARGGTGGSTKPTARNGIGIFVQSSDPGASAAEGDLWVW